MSGHLEFKNILNQEINQKFKLKSNLNTDKAVNNFTMLIQLIILSGIGYGK